MTSAGAALITLDIVSLQVVAAVGSIVAGAIHFIPGLTGEESRVWRNCWGSGKILIGITNAIGLFFDGTRLSLPERLTDVVLIIGLCLCVVGVSIFARRRPPIFILALLAITIVATLALLSFGDQDARYPVMVLGGTRTLFSFTAAWLLIGIARTEKLRTAWIMGVLFAASVPLFLVRTGVTIAAINAPSGLASAQWIANWSVGVAIILASLTQLALLLIEAERVHQTLTRQATRDCLTGALNRFGLGQIEPTLQGPITLLLIDIDRFKALNDGQGHAAGDTVLRLLADLAQCEIGDRGTLVRIGGDEFLCVLPGLDEAPAQVIAKRLSDRFDRVVAGVVDGPHYPSLSIGLARGMVEDKLDTLIAQADAAMYEVKRRGRAQPSSPRAIASAA